MTPAWLFFGVSLFGALYTLNAYRPFRLPVATVPVFFASWLTTELALHHIAWQAVASAIFIRLGALDAWPGWAGLGITLASWVGLAGLVRVGLGAGREMETSLREALGDGYRDEIDPDLAGRHGVGVPRHRLALAFYTRRRDVVLTRNLSYGPAGRRNRLDVWQRRDCPIGCPVLVWIHGGAWVIGQKYQQALPMLNHFASQGWVCVSANYRLSPRARFPDHLVDVKRVLAWVRAEIGEYGGDPSFVALSGGSAGGHLVSLAALTAGDPEYQPGFEDADTSVQACVPFYGVYDFTNRFQSRPSLEAWGFRRLLEQRVMKTPLATDPESYRKASPIDRIHEDAPPFLVIHGTHDVLAPVRDAREFASRLRETSREPVVYAELRGAQHAFEVFHSIRTTHVVAGVERFADWCLTRHRERQRTPRESPVRDTDRAAG